MFVLDEHPHIFTDSWFFLIEPAAKIISLKLAEQKVMKKPMIWTLRKLFFGYH